MNPYQTRAITQVLKHPFGELIGYGESMVIIIYTKKASNLTNRYGDMVPDRVDGQNGGRTVWADGCSQNFISPTLLEDKNMLK